VNGVISWDGETLKRHRSSDGVPGHEINRNALKIAPDGRLWIGSNAGVPIYQPLIDQSGSLPPPRVILSELQVNQVSLPTEKPIRLDYNQNSFSFHFYCPSYINEFENRYRHRLQGYETEWREVNGKLLSHAYYQNIPSGTYTFEIMAANAYGEWGPISRTSTVIIRSPFWKSPVFVISFALLSILIPLWGVFTLYRSAMPVAWKRKSDREPRNSTFRKRSWNGSTPNCVRPIPPKTNSSPSSPMICAIRSLHCSPGPSFCWKISIRSATK
jgi:hypothetical protein